MTQYDVRIVFIEEDTTSAVNVYLLRLISQNKHSHQPVLSGVYELTKEKLMVCYTA
jgi:hypothetical protein